MEPHQERVVVEKKELDEKIKKLSEFVTADPNFQTVPPAEQVRLHRQLCIMQEYSHILAERIVAFGSNYGSVPFGPNFLSPSQP